jgi:hypothetical protein
VALNVAYAVYSPNDKAVSVASCDTFGAFHTLRDSFTIKLHFLKSSPLWLLIRHVAPPISN